MRGELPDDYEIALTSQFEEIFGKKRGGVFVDAGAHCGTWTLRLAPLFDHVVAFEPHPENFNALNDTAPDNVTIWPGALSDVEAQQSLCLYDSPGHSALEGSPVMVGIEPTGRILVETMTLDAWEMPGKVDLIKIDTEGHELEVLAGARETLIRDRPRLCIENHSVGLRERALEFLTSIGLSDVGIWPDVTRRHSTEGGYLIRL